MSKMEGGKPRREVEPAKMERDPAKMEGRGEDDGGRGDAKDDKPVPSPADAMLPRVPDAERADVLREQAARSADMDFEAADAGNPKDWLDESKSAGDADEAAEASAKDADETKKTREPDDA